MTDPIVERIQARLEHLKISARKASQLAGFGPDLIREYHRGSTPTIRAVEKLAPVLDTTPEWLAFGRDAEARAVEVPLLPVIGEVAAGLWHSVDQSDEPLFDPIPVPLDPRFPREAQYGLLVRGTSINRIAQPGDVLQCLDIGMAGISPNDDDVVIVQQSRLDDSERQVTAKRYRRRNGVVELHPDSTDERWQTPIMMPEGMSGGDGIFVIAVVTGVYKPLRRLSSQHF